MNVGDRFKYYGSVYEIQEVRGRRASGNSCLVKNLTSGYQISMLVLDSDNWVFRKPPCQNEDSPFSCAVAEYKTSFDALDAAKKAEAVAWVAWKAAAETAGKAHFAHMAARDKFKNYVKENL